MRAKKSAKPELERRVRKLLRDIERGVVKLTSKEQPQDIYAGNVAYEASNGWKLVVFNDCNEWDYLDSAASPEGETLSFKEMSHEFSFSYRANKDVAWRCYGIPGYLKHRKTKWKGAP